MECVFLAIRRMVGLDAVIAALSLDYVPAPQASGGPCQVTARVKLAVDGSSYEGVSTCEDIVQSCAQAYLHALSQAEEACRLNGRPPEQFNCIW